MSDKRLIRRNLILFSKLCEVGQNVKISKNYFQAISIEVRALGEVSLQNALRITMHRRVKDILPRLFPV